MDEKINGLKRKLDNMKVLSIIVHILMMIIGIFLLFNLKSIVGIFSVAVVLYGLHLILKYFGDGDKRNGWDIISGIINVIFGAVMLFGGTETRVAGLLAIEIFVSFWILFIGFSYIFKSSKLKKEGEKHGLVLTGGIIMIICGIIGALFPLFSTLLFASAFAILLSAVLIFTGLTGLAAALSGSDNDKQAPA